MSNIMKINIAVLLFFVTYVSSEKSPLEGDYFQGDMILTPDQMMAIFDQESRGSNQFNDIKVRHWKTNGRTDTVRYYIDTSLLNEAAAVNAIESAINEYRKYVCIRFERVLRKPNDGPHISFFRGSGGCNTLIGRDNNNNGQPINLSQGCWFKLTVMHEIGHALGFLHEQTRPDRDDYVIIHWENIKEDYTHNFKKYTTDIVNAMGSYDYESMMHYGAYYFTKKHLHKTIETKDPKYQNIIGRGNGFSKGDIEQLNAIYRCDNGWNITTTLPPSTTGVCADQFHERFCKSIRKEICDASWFARTNCRKSCGSC